MNETYTIVDNFDKLDLSYVEVAKSGAPEAALREYYNPDQILSETVDFLWHTPIFFPPANETLWDGTGWESLYNVPYNFSSGWKYIPDMFRYITSRKFYIDQKTFTLEYPTEALRLSHKFPAALATKSILGMNYFFNLLLAEKNFNYNGVVFGNTLTFGRYYTPGPLAKSAAGWPIEMIPAWLGSSTTIGQVKEKLEYYATQPDYFWYYAGDKRYDNPLMFNYDQPPKKSKASSPYNLIHAPSFFSKQPDKGTPYDLLNAAEGQEIFLDYLQKLLLFEKWDFDPVGLWKQVLKHLYIVTDLPKGIGVIPPEYKYVKGSNVVQFDSTYNFYAEYAELLPQNILSEKQLPNLYTYYSLRKKKSQYYKDLVKLDTQTSVDAKKFTVQNYYNLTNKSRYMAGQIPVAGTAIPTGVNMTPMERYNTIIVENKDFLGEANDIADLFPMYNKISLPSKKSGFMNLLEGHNLSDEFITLLGNYFSTIGNKENYVHRFAIHNGESGDGVMLTPSYLQIMKLQDLFQNFGYEKYFYDNLCVKIGFKEPMMPPGPLGDGMLDNKSMAFYAIKKEAQSYFKTRNLMTSEIYKGKKCHTEVLAFEIAKYKTLSNGNRQHVQSIFLPSLGVDEEISYIDTQIFYGRDYTYEIFTHSLVIGSEYFHNRDTSGMTKEKGVQTYLAAGESVDIDGTAVYELLLPPWKETLNDPVPLVVRAPYFNTRTILKYGDKAKTSAALDKPPLPPQIAFHPYKDDENKLLVLLNHNYGERWLKPVYIFEEDEENFAKHFAAQKDPPPPVPGFLQFKTDDVRGQYVIFRTTHKPMNWKSFSDAEQTTLNRATQSGYNDIILPNVDYYYFARCIDAHGNLSNPTGIFYIRIVKEGGFPPYLISKIYNFSESVPEIIYDKNVKKYVKISLADNTRKVVKEGNIQSAKLSYKKANNGQLKKYKVRITSTKTGKKMDINVDFANTLNTSFFTTTTPEEGSSPNEVTLKEIAQKEKNASKEGKLGDGDVKIDTEPKGGLDGYGKPLNGFLD